MNNLDMLKVQYEWVVDIMKRIEQVLISKDYSDEDKLTTIAWYIKQAGKVEREE